MEPYDRGLGDRVKTGSSMKIWNISATAFSALFLCFAVSQGAQHARTPDQVAAAVQQISTGDSGSVSVTLCVAPDDPGWDCTT